MPEDIILELSHPDRPAGPVDGFRFLWAFLVGGFRPDQHCQRCFKGRRIASFTTRTARSGNSVAVRTEPGFPFLYVCGVGVGPKTDLFRQNLHFPVRYLEGEVATMTTYNGYIVVARNAIALSIPPLPQGWNGLGDEMTRCKNFQFAVASFGYPEARDKVNSAGRLELAPTSGAERAHPQTREATMAKRITERKRESRGLPGPESLFRGKVRAPVTVTLTREHHRKVNEAVQRLKLSRADVIGLLIEKYADTVAL
jgi:hypothetical protein